MIQYLEQKNGFWNRISKLCDRTVFLSFEKVGFFLHQKNFLQEDLDHSMQGKVCIVTGGNSGIGRETAKALAARGGQVYILCRNKEKGLQTVDELRELTKNHHIHLAHVDVSDLAQVQKFTKQFSKKCVDVLIHNAGGMCQERKTTKQGIEVTFATSVLGPYLLTLGLLAKLKASVDPRVIFVSSGGAYTQKLQIDKLIGNSGSYRGVLAYAQCKRAQIVLSELLASALKKDEISVYAMHPGWVDTPGVRSALPRFRWVMRLWLRNVEQGADSVVWLSVCPRLSGDSGAFWFDREKRPTHLLAQTKESSEARAALWDLCDEYCGNLLKEQKVRPTLPTLNQSA